MVSQAALGPVELKVVERVLSYWWARPRVEQAEVVWGRPHVVRVVTTDGHSAFVKRPRANRPGEGDFRNFGAEWSALEFLTRAADRFTPRLLGGDWDRRLMVMEELAPGHSLAASLLGEDSHAAVADLVAYGEALGRLHASSMAARAEYAECQKVRGLEESPLCGWAGTLNAENRAGFVTMLDEIGVPTRGLADELAEVYRVLFESRYLSLVHGDPCPDNVRIVDGRCWLMDFEISGLGCAALDASYLLAPFPSCWCFAALPAKLAAPAYDAYRQTLERAGISTRDGWEDAVQAALGCWVIARWRLYREAAIEDRTWGTATMRPRLISWARALADSPSDRFRRLRFAADALAAHSAEAWPEAHLPHFPALATGEPVAQIPSWWNERTI